MFLERIAHELRGPLGVILGALNEIERSHGAPATELQPLLRMARRGARRVLRTADRLDRAAQLEAASLVWGKTSIDLPSLVAEVVSDVIQLETRGGVRVEVRGEDGAPCFIDADAAWVRVAVAELVANAVRFARARVSVETAAVDGEARMTIVDDGPGFAGPEQARFEPPATGRGLGLSLPLVADVARAYAGRLEFRDRKSDGADATGTRARLVFPLMRESSRER